MMPLLDPIVAVAVIENQLVEDLLELQLGKHRQRKQPTR
jgi:hypothetical protein